MAYLGSTPTTSSQSLVKQDFSVSATQNYTLSQSVNNANDIALYINNVRQEPTYAYSASGTSLTLTAATAGSDDMYCIYLGRAVGTINPASGSVGLAQLSASGTKNSSTFLRGDNTFAEPSGGKVKQWITTSSLTNVSSTSAGTTKQSLGSIGPITPTSNSSTIYVIHNMFVLPYHTSGTSPQIGVGFEMHSDSGLSTVLTGTYGSTHTMYLQTANNTKYLYLPFCLQYAYSTSSADGHPGAGSAITYYHSCRNFNTTATPALRVTNLNAYIIEVE